VEIKFRLTIVKAVNIIEFYKEMKRGDATAKTKGRC